ncbi:TRAP transporter large permease [Chelatococcus sp. GCM10030263]|uniref:TRAP transporter large permease n=1 Tax=Chelatococcus sp. GCM10030263 TaxID=3273387 RepID=UPI003610163D
MTMSPELVLALSFSLFLLLLVGGMAVPFAIAVPGVVYLYLLGGAPMLRGLGFVAWGSMNSFMLTAIPIFVLMAEIIQHSGLGIRIYRGLGRLVSRLPGGLLQTNIAGCALFAAISGSSVATAASIGGVALPELARRRYDPVLSVGSLAAGGTLGILIPPSIIMIIYASFTETSVAKLFMAGVVPGVLLTAMFMGYIALRSRIGPSIQGGVAEHDDISIRAALVEIAPVTVLILATLGSIYLGLATPTEAAAGGCVIALILAWTVGDLPWSRFVECLQRTVRVVGNILFIIAAAYIYAYAISMGRVGESLTAWLVSLDLSKFEFYIALFVLYTVLGCLVESAGMIVITVPLLYPVLQQYGIDLIWFGIVLVLYIEMALISPPIGINLFVIQSIWKGSFRDVVVGTIPFHLLMIVLLILLTLFPEIALWLPSQMLGE